MALLKDLTASAARAFEVGNFATIAQGLGAKYGKKVNHSNDDGHVPNQTIGSVGAQKTADTEISIKDTDAVETSFLSDAAGQRALDSSILQMPSHSTTPASSVEKERGSVDDRAASHSMDASCPIQKPTANLVWHTGEGIDLHFTSPSDSQEKLGHDTQADKRKRPLVNPKKDVSGTHPKVKVRAKEKKSYASVLQQGVQTQTQHSPPKVIGPLECPPDLTYASYGATLRLEERKQTIKLGLCEESLAALAGRSRSPPNDTCRVHRIFIKPSEKAVRAEPNLLSSGYSPRPKYPAKTASKDPDVEAVLASQWNSGSKKITAIHRAVTEMVDEELAKKHEPHATTKRRAGTHGTTNLATTSKDGIIADGNLIAGKSVKDPKLKKDQAVPISKPESMRASDGGSCIQCVDVSEQAKSSENDSGINPLKDIQKWSVEYFRKHDPLVAERMAAFNASKKSDPSMEDSGSDTRFLDENRSLLVPVTHPNPNKQKEWLDFTGQHRNGRKYGPRPDVEIHAQLSSWDGDFRPPKTAHLENACWKLGHISAMTVDRWIEFNVDIKNHYRVDESSPGFRSGASRPSGLLTNRFFHPPEILHDGLNPDFSAIDWSKNVTHPPQNIDQLSPFQRLQCSELCRQITLAPYLEKIAEVEMLRDEAHKKLGCAVENVKAVHFGNPWVPQANFYIRPARPIDIPQLVSLYNEWIKNSIFTKREISINEKEFVEDFEERKKTGLPFLVAATKSSRGDRGSQQLRGFFDAQQRRGRHVRRLTLQTDRQEKIIGFAFAETYHDVQNVFRGVIEMKLFVSPSFLRLGIGKTLLDRIMTYADPWYQSKRGTRFEFDEREDDIAYKLGPSAKVRKVLIDVLYSSDQAQDFTWKKDMLETKFGFHQAGFFLNFGERDHKPINMATFVRESFNAAGNKSMMYPGQLKEIEGIFSPTAIYPDEIDEF